MTSAHVHMPQPLPTVMNVSTVPTYMQPPPVVTATQHIPVYVPQTMVPTEIPVPTYSHPVYMPQRQPQPPIMMSTISTESLISIGQPIIEEIVPTNLPNPLMPGSIMPLQSVDSDRTMTITPISSTSTFDGFTTEDLQEAEIKSQNRQGELRKLAEMTKRELFYLSQSPPMLRQA
jgi:hypothetical protein